MTLGIDYFYVYLICFFDFLLVSRRENLVIAKHSFSVAHPLYFQGFFLLSVNFFLDGMQRRWVATIGGAVILLFASERFILKIVALFVVLSVAISACSMSFYELQPYENSLKIFLYSLHFALYLRLYWKVDRQSGRNHNM